MKVLRAPCLRREGGKEGAGQAGDGAHAGEFAGLGSGCG